MSVGSRRELTTMAFPGGRSLANATLRTGGVRTGGRSLDDIKEYTSSTLTDNELIEQGPLAIGSVGGCRDNGAGGEFKLLARLKGSDGRASGEHSKSCREADNFEEHLDVVEMSWVDLVSWIEVELFQCFIYQIVALG